MKKVLLTGASGFIGRHTITYLVEKGYEVYAVVYPNKSDLNESKSVFLYQVDIFNSKERKQLFDSVKPSHLLHFAWYAVPGKYWTSLENFRWVQVSIDILLDFIENNGKRAVLAGTCAEYDWRYGYCSEGITPTKPQTLYGTCKNSLQEMLHQLSNQTNISSAWGRIFFPYGPYEANVRLIPSVITSLLQDKPARCTHGNQVRDFIHVNDVASAFVSLLDSEVKGPVNIASGQAITLKSIIYSIADLLNKKHLVELGVLPTPETDAPFIAANIHRLSEEVGWNPSITLETGLKSTIEWWKQRL